MVRGIRVEVRIDAPAGCPVAAVSAGTEGSCRLVAKTSVPDDGGRTTEEFVHEPPPDGGSDPTDLLADDIHHTGVRVFGYDRATVYQFRREAGSGCPCELVEQAGCPVSSVEAQRGTLSLCFHARSLADARDALGRLREAYPATRLARLHQEPADADGGGFVMLDRERLTDRQHEVLRTAHEMGYFEHPKGANAGEVATALGITTATFTEILSAAQRKIHEPLLNGDRTTHASAA